ncbi:MAG: GNAT family N-acetyltransferase [Pseudobdellovibrionaceae bacterium]
MSFKMRLLLAEDEGRVLQLVGDLYRLHPHLEGFQWPSETLRAEFQSTEGWGVFKGLQLISFVLYRMTPVAWEVSVVASHPDYWRQGLTRSLLSHLIVIKPSDRELWLEVHNGNTRAWKLYESLGFVRTGTRDNYYPNNGTAWLYTLR